MRTSHKHGLVVTTADEPVAADRVVTSAPAEAVAISVRGLSKTYGKRRDERAERALKDVDLDVREGEFLVLLGPSGCGKTTLLRSIAGLEYPDEGSITIDEDVVYDSDTGVNLPPQRRPVSMIFQMYALWPHMTARQNVAFPLRCAKVKRSEIGPRVKDILEKVGIGELIDRYPGQMSGGQQQRLALARALVVGRRIVLFDEPLSNVDAQVRQVLRLELIKMQRTLGFTAIYVTHDQTEAMELADRLAVMSRGRIVQLDAPLEMYRKPKDIHVARFLGQSNEVSITVDSFDEGTRRVTGSGFVGSVTAEWQPGSNAEVPQAGEQFAAFGRPSDFLVVGARMDDEVAESDSPIFENQWQGKIEAVRFLGSHAECVVMFGEGRLRCWMPADRNNDLREGSEVSILVPAHKLQAMRESARVDERGPESS